RSATRGLPGRERSGLVPGASRGHRGRARRGVAAAQVAPRLRVDLRRPATFRDVARRPMRRDSRRIDIHSTHELSIESARKTRRQARESRSTMTRAPITVSALVGVVLAMSCGGSASPPAGPTPAAATAAASTPTAVQPQAPAESAAPAVTGQAPKAPVALEEYLNIRRIGSRSGILLSFSHDEKLVAYLSDE